MSLYKCNTCNATREITQKTIKIINGTAEVVEALCDCGKYMKDTTKFTGYPNLIRTEPSLKG